MTLSPDDPTTWNVLVADNEMDSIHVVQYLLEFYKARVRSAPGGPECLDQLEAEVPNILFLDIQMPKVSGWDIIRKIRENSQWQQIIVIAMTAHAMAGDKEKILSAGFDAYLSKPLSPSTLLQQTKELLRKAMSQSRA
jgi:CheY-like chemotaxis protein